MVAAACVLSQAPASSAACSTTSGVSVVVDPGALGGSIATVCDPGSGEVAATRFEQSGFALTEVQRFPGFVCRVNGAPASDPCVNTPPPDAYWSLWWTDGTSGAWNYSSEAVTSLDVPDGGAVALAWQQGAARRTPAVAAPVQAAPSPSEKPTPSPTKKPTPQPARTPTTTPTPSATSSAPTTPTATPTESAPSASATADPSGPATTDRTPSSPSAPSSTTATNSPSDTSAPAPSTTTPTDSPTTEPRAAEEESGRVPTWLTLAILAMLLVAIGMSAYAARRRTRS